MTIDKKIGKRIRDARRANGFSQEDLGDACSVTRSSISLWEKGRSLPEDENLQTAARALGTTPQYLLTGKGKPPAQRPLPESNYRRDMMARMQRLIASGMFDELLARLGYHKQRR
jgi:transcriptional regulator with XRE-family HTH domain